jgi:hypothetical protein
MCERPDLGPRTPSVVAGAWDGVVGYVTTEDVAFAAELAELDRADRESGVGYDADLEAPPAWDGAEPCDDDLVAALAGAWVRRICCCWTRSIRGRCRRT